MSVQPIQRINRVDFVTVLITGLLFEVGFIVALVPEPKNVVTPGSSGNTSNLLLWAILLAALGVAYALGRGINITTMWLWRPDALPFVGKGSTASEPDEDKAAGSGNIVAAKSHRARFDDLLANPSSLGVDETIVREFKIRLDHAFEEDGPFFPDGRRDDIRSDDRSSENPSESEDYMSLWPFVVSYVRFKGGDFSTFVETVFTFTRNGAVLFFGLFGLYTGVWILSALCQLLKNTLFTSLGFIAKVLVVSSLFGMGVLFRHGALQNRDDYVTYLVSDFITLRIVEEERAAPDRGTDGGCNHDS